MNLSVKGIYCSQLMTSKEALSFLLSIFSFLLDASYNPKLMLLNFWRFMIDLKAELKAMEALNNFAFHWTWSLNMENVWPGTLGHHVKELSGSDHHAVK